jgi:hypothetical protein
VVQPPVAPTTRHRFKTLSERRDSYNGRPPMARKCVAPSTYRVGVPRDGSSGARSLVPSRKGGTVAPSLTVQSASLIGPSMYSGYHAGIVGPPPGSIECNDDYVQHTTHCTNSTYLPVMCNKGPLQARDFLLQKFVGRLDAPLHATPNGHGHLWSEDPRSTFLPQPRRRVRPKRMTARYIHISSIGRSRVDHKWSLRQPLTSRATLHGPGNGALSRR